MSLLDIRVLDLGRVFAGPWAAQTLADLGADVIKIEHVRGGDDVRRMGVPERSPDGQETGRTSSFLAMNRGKRSLAVNLASPAGQEIVRELARTADVLIENFKTGDLARYGLDHESLRPLNPGLVYCSITSFGQDGPYAALPGYDPIIQAMSGLMSVTGQPDGAPGAGPVLTGYSIADINAGLHATVAILAALHARDTGNGEGRHIDISLLDAQFSAQSHIATNYLVSGKTPVRAGAASQMTAPWQTLNTADRPLMVAVGTDRQFQALCEALGTPELAADERFSGNRQRLANRAQLETLLEASLRRHPADHWMQTLSRAGLAVGPVNDFVAASNDPQLSHRGMIRRRVDKAERETRYVANPLRFDGEAPQADLAPPEFAEHTALILGEELGYDETTIARLADEGVIALAPPPEDGQSPGTPQ